MPPPTGFQRFLLAFVAFFKVWFDRAFAERVWALRQGEAPAVAPPPKPSELAAPAPTPAPARAPSKMNAAVQLLAVLQREGRLVDFLQEDLGGASDADLAAVVRGTLYAGCRKALGEHVKLAPVRAEAEGAQVTIEAGFDPGAIRLTGNVVGSPPFKGTLAHRGWRATEVKLPEPTAQDPLIVAPAEVELP